MSGICKVDPPYMANNAIITIINNKCDTLRLCCKGLGVGLAVVAGGFAVANAFASGVVVTLVTAVVAFIGIRMVIRCLR